MANFVQLYKSTDLNAPPLFGATGSLINVLNACLVDGYGYTGQSITSITRVTTVATVTVSAAVGLKIKDQSYVTVSGCTSTGAAQYNIGAIWTRTSATTYTYNMVSDPGASASGTPVASLALSVTSLTESSTNYTAVLAQSDTTLAVGQYITFAGASPGGANIAMKINTVSSPTQVICTGPGGLGAISGTITYMKSPLAWARPFAAGTNSQTYRSADTGSNRMYLQVVDNAGTAGLGKEAQVSGAEVMTADQAASSGQFPTAVQLASGLCWRKSTTADSTTPRAWVLWGDDKTFYLIITTGDSAVNHGFWGGGFGHYIPFKPGDGFNTFIAGGGIFNATTAASVLNGIGNSAPLGQVPTMSMYGPRSYTQTGSSVLLAVVGYGGSGVGKGAIGGAVTSAVSGVVLTYPNPQDSGFYVNQLLVTDTVNALRGRMPGYYQPLHQAPFNNYDQVTGVTGLSGVTLTALSVSGFDNNNGNVTGQVLVDTFGPWT